MSKLQFLDDPSPDFGQIGWLFLNPSLKASTN
jgi:hypothetical protein